VVARGLLAAAPAGQAVTPIDSSKKRLKFRFN
jgi:hypothetical protein